MRLLSQRTESHQKFWVRNGDALKLNTTVNKINNAFYICKGQKKKKDKLQP